MKLSSFFSLFLAPFCLGLGSALATLAYFRLNGTGVATSLSVITLLYRSFWVFCFLSSFPLIKELWSSTLMRISCRSGTYLEETVPWLVSSTRRSFKNRLLLFLQTEPRSIDCWLLAI